MEYLSMIFWLFFIFSLLTPWLKQRNLEVSRISLINRIEKERKSRIIALIHRQETMSILGIPIIRYINIEDSEAVLRAIRLTEIQADIARKAIRQVRAFVKKLLFENNCSKQKAEKLAQILTEGRWTHDYPITFEEAKKLGLCVSSEMPKEIYELMDLYPQNPGKRPSVSYIPLPYKKTTTPPAKKVNHK